MYTMNGTLKPYTSNISYELNNGIISHQTAERFLGFLDCGLFPILILSGVLMNTLSFIVLLLQRFKNRANIVLLGLAISDNAFLIVTFLRKMSCIVSNFDKISASNLRILMTPHVFIIGMTFARITSILTVLISTERLAVVLWPLKTRIVLSPKRIKILIALIFLITAIFFAPLFFVYKVRTKFNYIVNHQIMELEMTEFYLNNRSVIDIYSSLVLNILLRFLPCVIVAGSTGALVIYLRRHIKWRIRSTNMNKADLLLEERRVTKTLIFISVMYVFCLFPGTIFTLISYIYTDFDWNEKYHNLFTVLGGINSLLECANSSFNFVIYMLTNRTFSSKFHSLRRKRDCRKAEEREIGSHETCL